MKSRGIRFPGRDNESLAPIFTPPRSVVASEPDAGHVQEAQYDVQVPSYTAEQTKEAFDVARNSIELLTTVLSSSPQQDALKVVRNIELYPLLCIIIMLAHFLPCNKEFGMINFVIWNSMN